MIADLIARLEAATGPDRDLDDMIWKHHDKAAWNASPNGDDAPPFSASLDAALSLVPGGWLWALENHSDNTLAKLYGPGCEDADIETWGSTPALALCIAALKAREAAQ